MANGSVSTISITPPLTLDDLEDGPELRTIELIHLRADGEPFPAEPWTANAIDARDSGMNYRPEFIGTELQQVVDHYASREFVGFIEVRNSSPNQAPVARYYARGRRVEMMTRTLVWPGDEPQAVPPSARQQIAAELESHAESIGWYEGGGVWAEALDVIRQEPWTRRDDGNG